MDNYSRELRGTLTEATLIKQDLEKLMENSVELSRLIVDHIDVKIARVDSLGSLAKDEDLAVTKEYSAVLTETAEDISAGQDDEQASRLKVFELARELNISSKSLITTLRDMGYPVSHHMKLLDDRVAQLVREEYVLKNIKVDCEGTGLINVSSQSAGKVGAKNEVAIHRINENNIKESQHLTLVTQEGQASGKREKDETMTIDFSADDLKSAHPYLAVRSLYERGWSVRQIAQLLDRGQGEVNLILSLTNKKQAIG
ncbi:MAG: translation initiation factor IF-2 N-terminal domain-containing protein [Syntrophomonas sp.]